MFVFVNLLIASFIVQASLEYSSDTINIQWTVISVRVTSRPCRMTWPSARVCTCTVYVLHVLCTVYCVCTVYCMYCVLCEVGRRADRHLGGRL